MLRFTPSLAGKRNLMCGFHRPSKMRFLRFRLLSDPYCTLVEPADKNKAPELFAAARMDTLVSKHSSEGE